MTKRMSGMFILIGLSALLVGLQGTGCAGDNPRARQALENQGFTDVRFTGHVWFACSDDDWIHAGFVAKNAKEQEVSGVVCCGAFKGCTVRW